MPKRAFLQRFQWSLQCLVLPCAQQRHRVGTHPITYAERPLPTIRADTLFAVIELITVVVQSDAPPFDFYDKMAGIDLIPRLATDLGHHPTLEDDFTKFLAHVPIWLAAEIVSACLTSLATDVIAVSNDFKPTT